MEFETPKSKVYIQTDEQGRILRCDGGYTPPAYLTDWTYIDEGTGDKYNLCQNHYFDGGLYTMDGIPRYRWDGTQAVERTPPPTTDERITILEKQLVQADETSIALYEGQEAQETINAQQDEALMEIYEMIG